jgi:hypothetical protein
MPRATASAEYPVKVPISTARRAPIARTMISISTAWSSPICMPAAGPVRSAVTFWRSSCTASGPDECADAYASMCSSVKRERCREVVMSAG